MSYWDASWCSYLQGDRGFGSVLLGRVLVQLPAGDRGFGSVLLGRVLVQLPAGGRGRLAAFYYWNAALSEALFVNSPAHVM